MVYVFQKKGTDAHYLQGATSKLTALSKFRQRCGSDEERKKWKLVQQIAINDFQMIVGVEKVTEPEEENIQESEIQEETKK